MSTPFQVGEGSLFFNMLFDGSTVNIGIAFLGGLLTFLAPCVLPILPAYIGYISGVGLQDQSEQSKTLKSKIFLNSLTFVLGFLIVFVVLGVTAQSAGIFLHKYQRPIQIAGGILFVLLGLHLAGVFSLKIFNKHAQFHIGNHLTKYQYLNSFLVGLVFGFGWTPCIGPILAVILFWASQSDTFWKGFWLLLSFGLGLGIPFLFLSLFTEQIMKRLRKMQKAFRYAQIIAGLLIIVVGILLVGDWLNYVSAPLLKYGTLETWLAK